MSSSPAARIEGRTVAVTGADGVIGRAVARHLLAGGARVVGIDRAEADITKPGALRELFRGCFACIHLAGQKSARVSPEAVRACFVENTIGTLEVAEACRAQGVKRIVLASTGYVYAPAPTGRISESDPLSPASAYAASKVAAEAVLAGYATSAGLECAFARMSNIYGGVPDANTIVGRALLQAQKAEPIALRTHDAVRDFIHLDDVALALVALTTCSMARAEAFNVASGTELSSGEVARRVAAAAERAGIGRLEVRPPETNEPPGMARFAFDTNRIRSRTGWKPTIDFDNGLDRTFALRTDSRPS